MNGPSATPMSGLPYLGGALVLALAGAIAACGDAGSNSLMSSGVAGAPQHATPSGPSQDTGTTGGAPTLPTSSVPPVDAGPPETKGEQLFRALQTQLIATCGG